MINNKIYSLFIIGVTLFLYTVFKQSFTLAGGVIEFVYLKYGFTTLFLYILLIAFILATFLCVTIVLYSILLRWQKKFKILSYMLLLLIILKYLNYQMNIYLAEYSAMNHDEHINSFVAQTVIWEYFNYTLLLVLLFYFYTKRGKLKSD